MAWNYDIALTAARDQVRLIIGDTDGTDPQLQDEEINFLLTDNGDVVNRAALACCEALQAKYARMVDTKVDGLQEGAGERIAHYSLLIAQLRAKLARGGIRPLMGGQSRAAKQAARSASDLVQPAFRRDQFQEHGMSSGDVPSDDPLQG
jgi:hypothetical protein